MNTIRTIAGLRETLSAHRHAGRTIGFVPTMGYFHEGHRSLMQRARTDCDVIVVSLFVNPLQFNDPADLGAYPRDETRDAAMAHGAGVDVLFAPAVDELYPQGFATTVAVAGLTDVLEGASRGAGHFRGVTTVVAKLFNIVQPTIAYFGQKDAQQALVVRRMARDLDFPLRIEVLPTVREPDGLAMSSRNVRLSPEQRAAALALHRALAAAAAAIAGGERDPRRILETSTALMRAAAVEPEYFAIVDPETLAPATWIQGELLVAVAASVGPVRLIDNVRVHAP